MALCANTGLDTQGRSGAESREPPFDPVPVKQMVERGAIITVTAARSHPQYYSGTIRDPEQDVHVAGLFYGGRENHAGE